MAASEPTVAGLAERLRRDIPTLPADQAAELSGALERIISALQPERIYLFGSQARGDARADSDIDLLVVVPYTDEFPHRLDQAAYRAMGLLMLPIDVLVMTAEEFELRSRARSSLPATALREGKLLYAA